MTIKQCYDAAGGKFEDVLARLGSEERVIKFSSRFFETGDYESLEKSVSIRDVVNAFNYAHRIKGNALNVGFDHFVKTIDPLVEFLRSREIEDENTLDQLFDTVKKEYFTLKKVFSQL